MLTTKKRGGFEFLLTLAAIALALVLAGCTPPGPRALLEGERLVKENRFGDAIEQLRKATLLMPNNAQAWNHLGLACHLAGLPREADDAYRKALNINPNLAAARFNLGCLWLELNRPADAAIQFGSYVILEPKSLEARVYLGVAQLRAGRTDEAERTFREVLGAHGSEVEAMNGYALTQVQRKRTRDAAATLYTAVQTKPSYQPAMLNFAIVNHLYLNNKPLALQYYRNYLTLTPKPIFFDAVASLVRQLEAEMNQARPSTNQANVPGVTNRPPAVVGNPVREPPRTNLISQSEGRTNPPAPRTNPAPITLTAPTNPPPLITSTPITKLPAVTNPAPVVERRVAEAPPTPSQFPRYKYLHPAKPEPGDHQKALSLYFVGEKAQQENRVADAILNFEAATKVDPAFAEAYSRLGRVAMEVDKVKAMTAYEHALAINPDSASTRFNFALALYQAGFLLDAAEEFEAYYQKNPKDVQGRLFLANLYAQNLKMTAKAREQYQKLLELEPQHPQANAIREWLLKNP